MLWNTSRRNWPSTSPVTVLYGAITWNIFREIRAAIWRINRDSITKSSEPHSSHLVQLRVGDIQQTIPVTSKENISSWSYTGQDNEPTFITNIYEVVRIKRRLRTKIIDGYRFRSVISDMPNIYALHTAEHPFSCRRSGLLIVIFEESLSQVN
jgi:hypothetical protein